MRILFLGNGHLRADDYPNVNMGGSVQTWGLGKELAKRGHEVYIVRRSNSKEEETVENVKLIGVKFRGMEDVVPTTNLFFHIFLLFSKFYFSVKSYQIIKRISPDVICFIDRQTATFLASLNSRKIFIMHSPEALDFFKPYSIHANKLNSVLFYVIKILQDRIIEKSDYVVVLNNYIKAQLRKKGLSKIVRIPNGIDMEKLSNRGDKNFILYAGRFDWNKNVCCLVDAFAEVSATYSDCKLYLVGEGPEEGKVVSLVKKKGLQSSVNIIPWLPRKKLMSLMSKSSVFVLPSFFEVFPVTVLEAMALANPVIARTNMGTVDIIEHGKNGYLYNNERELRKHIELLLSDDNLRKKIGCNARKTVEEKYSFARIADKYEELFYTLIRESESR